MKKIYFITILAIALILPIKYSQAAILLLCPIGGEQPQCNAYTYSDCQPDGKQEAIPVYKTDTNTSKCCTENSSYESGTYKECVYNPPVCTKFYYSNWSICENDKQTRTITSSSPENCEGGEPILEQECISCKDYKYTNWSDCMNGWQIRNVIGSLPVNCEGELTIDAVLSQQCEEELKDEQIDDLETNDNNNENIDTNLSNKLSGKLLLQVNQGGRIWYVNPSNSKKFEITFANALPLFENFALGISNDNLDDIPLSDDDWTSTTGNRLKGKLLLQVEQNGRIWYVDFDGKRWEVTWANLMELFESLALGITDEDLNKIETGELD